MENGDMKHITDWGHGMIDKERNMETDKGNEDITKNHAGGQDRLSQETENNTHRGAWMKLYLNKPN